MIDYTCAMLDVACAWNEDWGTCLNKKTACLWMWKKMGRKRTGNTDTALVVNRVNRTLFGWLAYLREYEHCDDLELHTKLEYEDKLLRVKVYLLLLGPLGWLEMILETQWMNDVFCFSLKTLWHDHTKVQMLDDC